MSPALLSVLLLAQPQNLALSPESLWAREPQALTSEALAGGGLRIRHSSQADWALRLGPPFPVRQGEAWKVKAKIRTAGPQGQRGSASLSFVVRKGDQVEAWTASSSPSAQPGDFREIEALIVAKTGVTSLEPRLVGDGEAVVEIQSATLVSMGRLAILPESAAPAVLENPSIKVSVKAPNGQLEVLDKRTGRTWKTEDTTSLLFQRMEVQGRTISLEGKRMEGLEPFTASLTLPADKPEIRLSIQSQGRLTELDYPGPFQPEAKDSLIVPENMGIEMPVADPRFSGFWLPGFGGHGLCMAFWAQSSPQGTALTVIEDPDDFFLIGSRGEDGLLRAGPRWIGEKKAFSYPRRLRLVFLKESGHVAAARRYREFAKEKGLVVTLAEKAKKNPNVVRMAHAANFWHWGDAQGDFAKQVHAAGLRGLLWSGGGNPEDLKIHRQLGYIASRYDIYQDVMDPAQLANLLWIHGDWVQKAWPHDLLKTENGDWERGWVVQDKNGKDLPCGVVCDKQAVAYAKERIGQELKTHPFEARFIDTTTASSWRECWDPSHPMTRRESRKHKMELLQLVTDFGLVAGSETGHEASVPHLVFFEGMMSLGPYRVDDSGTNPPKIYDQLPEKTLTVQLGPRYRLPLWQLVYGDCTVSGWYWGDFNNKHLPTWKTRDLWNCLYGTPAMYFTDPAQFEAQKAEFVRSWTLVDKAQKATAMSLMTHHRFLTPDRKVQQTEWSNGARITVNFGDTAWTSGSLKVDAMSCLVDKVGQG